MENEYLTPECLPIMLHSEEIAAVLDITPGYARILMKQADFPAVRIGRRYTVARSDFLNWLTEQEIHSDENGK